MTSSGHPDAERFARVAEAFHTALDTEDADQRQAFLAALRTQHPDIATEVETLLDAHARVGDFIEQPATASSLDASPDRGLSHLPIGRPVGHYNVLGLIGEGGMGVVYLAEDTRLGRTVALKAVRSEFADDETRVARLRREARAAAALSHPGIATVYALEEIDGRLYVASEFVAGETLRDELSRGPLAPSRVRDIAIALARALSVAHERGIVHRDLKPDNIVTSSKGELKVLDFGLAQFADPQDNGLRTRDGGVLGTPAYMSPEQIRGGSVDGRSDLFALGVIVYELATGQHPFMGPTSAATMAQVIETPAPAFVPALPADVRANAEVPALAAVVAACLEKAADRRPQSAADVVAMLESPSARSDSRPERSLRTPSVLDGPMWARQRAAAGQPSGAPEWWWQFHQAATTVAYALLLFPVWRVRHMTEGSFGIGLFFTGLVAVVVAGMLRLHLWFALRQYPGEWFDDHQISRRLVRAADITFVGVLAARGFTAIRLDDPSAALLIAAAASVAVSSTIIEPATTRAMAPPDR